MADIAYSVAFPEDIGAGTPAAVLEKSWFPASPGSNAPMNFWQMGGSLARMDEKRANPVYACRRVLAEEVARLKAYHYRRGEQGGKVRLHSTLGRILRFPNHWQTSVDFWLNMVDALLCDGNAYALADRDDRGAISSLAKIHSAHPYVEPESGEVFYHIAVNYHEPLPRAADVDPRFMVPARSILHLRLFTPVHPLMGESPLVAAAVAANTGTSISNSNFSFFNRAARPSGYLRYPGQLDAATRLRLKEVWTEAYSGTGTGGTAVLDEGLEWHPMTMSAVDAEIVALYKMSVSDVARIFRVPLFMLGDLSEVKFNTVEQLLRVFLAGGLGFYLRLIEEKLAQFFQLDSREWVEFDVQSGLLRTEFKDRIDGLTRGVQGGLYVPNEARREEGLPAVEGGDQLLVQQQMVPVSLAGESLQQDMQGTAPQAPEEEEERLSVEDVRAMVREKLKAA